MFTIVAGVLVALNADRLSHRRRLAVMANYFEHVLDLPLAFHTSTHSAAVLKVMLEGSGGHVLALARLLPRALRLLVALLVPCR
jgi:ATP-binding cassette subfamily B protein